MHGPSWSEFSRADGAAGRRRRRGPGPMRAIGLLALTCLLLARATATASEAPSEVPLLRLVQTIPMTGVDGRIDHLAIDVTGRRLFVCALGNGTLEVVDLEKSQRVQSVPGFK